MNIAVFELLRFERKVLILSQLKNNLKIVINLLITLLPSKLN